MFRLLAWASIVQFISAPVFLVAAIWNSEWKFLWISFAVLLSSLFTSAFGSALQKQSKANQDATLF